MILHVFILMKTSVMKELCEIDFRFISTQHHSEDEVPSKMYSDLCVDLPSEKSRDLFCSEFASDADTNVGRVSQWTIFGIINRKRSRRQMHSTVIIQLGKFH